MTRLETLAALKKYEDGVDLSPPEQELMNRAVEVNDWLVNRCLYAEVIPSLLEATAEVLTRIPQSALEGLIGKETYLVFPAMRGSYAARLQIQHAEALSFVVLASNLAKSPRSEAIGFVAHELAHVFLAHTTGGDTNELAADDLARSWGFTEEIGIVNTLYPRSH